MKMLDKFKEEFIRIFMDRVAFIAYWNQWYDIKVGDKIIKARNETP